MANELHFVVEIVSFGASIASLGSSILLLFSIFSAPTSSAKIHSYKGMLWQQGLSIIMATIIHGLFASFCVSCSISILRHGKLHRFIKEFFNFLDVVLLRGIALFVMGWNQYSITWLNYKLTTERAGVTAGGWGQDIGEVLSFLTIMGGATLSSLHYYHRNDISHHQPMGDSSFTQNEYQAPRVLNPMTTDHR